MVVNTNCDPVSVHHSVTGGPSPEERLVTLRSFSHRRSASADGAAAGAHRRTAGTLGRNDLGSHSDRRGTVTPPCCSPPRFQVSSAFLFQSQDPLPYKRDDQLLPRGARAAGTHRQWAPALSSPTSSLKQGPGLLGSDPSQYLPP